jgi:hypothetical protein
MERPARDGAKHTAEMERGRQQRGRQLAYGTIHVRRPLQLAARGLDQIGASRGCRSSR